MAARMARVLSDDIFGSTNRHESAGYSRAHEMIVASLLTKPNGKEALDRLYVRMKTPVDPNPEKDAAELEKSYANPERFNDRKLFKHPDIEIQRPTSTDFWGFLACFAICFLIIGLILLVAGLGT